MKWHIQVLLLAASCFPLYADAAPLGKSAKTQQSLELNEQGMAAVQRKDLTAAEKLFKSALDLDSGNVTAAFNYAGILLGQKRSKEAIDLLKRYTKSYPKDPGLFVRLGDCYFATKDIGNAQIAYEKALTLNRGYPNLLSKLGTVYGLQKRVIDAEKLYTEAVQRNPADPLLLESLAALQIANGKLALGIETTGKAIQMAPSARLYEMLGGAQELNKDPEQALAAYKKAKELGSTAPEIPKAIQYLEGAAATSAKAK